MAMYYRTFNHSEGDRHREFEERWEKKWQEELSQRLGTRNKEQHDLIEDLQEKIHGLDVRTVREKAQQGFFSHAAQRQIALLLPVLFEQAEER